MKTALLCYMAACFSAAMAATAAKMNVASIMENQVQESIRSIEEKCPDLPSHSSQKLRALLGGMSQNSVQPDGDGIRETVLNFVDAFKSSEGWMDPVSKCFAQM